MPVNPFSSQNFDPNAPQRPSQPQDSVLRASSVLPQIPQKPLRRRTPLFFLFILIVFFLLILAVAAFFLYQKFSLNPSEGDTSVLNSSAGVSPPSSLPSPAETTETEGEAPLTVDEDADNDGLNDAEEEKYGTDPVSFDTDKDGLSDRSEIEVYQTDPLKEDTDGDGYPDGDEVQNLYNPKGEGELRDVNQAIQNIDNQ